MELSFQVLLKLPVLAKILTIQLYSVWKQLKNLNIFNLYLK